MKLNILVTGYGGDVSNGVLKAFKDSNAHFNLFSSGIKKLKNRNYIRTSTVQSKKYIKELRKIIREKNINLLIPTIDQEQIKISSQKFNCIVMVNKYEIIKKLADKYLLSLFLKKNFYGPLTYLYNKKPHLFKYPYIIKKRIGWGNKFNYLIDSKKKESNYSLNDQFIVQEYLRGNDFTSSFYVKKKKIYVIVFRRRLKNGSSIYIKKINDKNIINQLKLIIKKTNLLFGNIQFKIKNKKIYIYEINPRLSGTLEMQRYFLNSPIMFVNHKLNANIFLKVCSKNFFKAKKTRGKWIIEK
jgi:carbamoyl-phosphate synthase large subunit